MMILRVLLGLAVMVVGFLFVYKSETVFRWFGRNRWAEEKLGSSRLFYKLIGLGISLLGILIATNIISEILRAFAQLFNRS